MNEISSVSRVYVDSNIFIYFLELNPDYFIKAQEFFVHVDTVGARLFTNEYTLAECIYRPSRDGNFSLAAKYESLFER
jgi:predicted nucleic acid-binding protein